MNVYSPAAENPSGIRALFPRRPELLVFAGLIILFSGSVLFGSVWQSMVFQPAAVRSGEWWRLFTHPFVHVTWYHLLLDASAFFLLYNGLIEVKAVRRLAYVAASAAGSLLLSWLAVPAISTSGLCGLSGIAHGLMAVSAVEMMVNAPRRSSEWRIGAITFAVVMGKAVIEAITGRILFGFLYFGLVGDPVAVSHAAGIVGGLSAMLLLRAASRAGGPHRTFGQLSTGTADVRMRLYEKGKPLQTSGVYLDRVAGRHSHHCHSGSDAFARPGECQGTGQAHSMHEQFETSRHWRDPLRGG